MNLSLKRALTIARREYLTTIRRKAFLFTVIATPAYFAFVMWISIRPQIEDRAKALKNFHALGVVDSSGMLSAAPREVTTDWSPEANPLSSPAANAMAAPAVETFRTQVRRFPDLATAEAALRAHELDQVLVVPADYLETGHLRRYARSSGLFSSSEERPIVRWLVGGLLAGQADSNRVARVVRPLSEAKLYTLGRDGQFELKDDRREMMDFMLPFMLGMLLSVCIVTGGQYLLQGVAEEKESRILESMLCMVSSEDLMFGKLIGLGGAGLTLAGIWVVMGLTLSAPAAMIAQLNPSPLLGIAMLAFLLLGYTFYASLMTGIGAITNSMREAQQFAFMFTFMNFVPFIMMTTILGHPDGGVALGLSLFPPTAPTAMMLRLAAPGASVPGWQIALSLALLAGSACVAVMAAARVFRVGLLMHGKTPNLPEILRWARQG
jgi:ABC-2 type transport system permease protein